MRIRYSVSYHNMVFSSDENIENVQVLLRLKAGDV